MIKNILVILAASTTIQAMAANETHIRFAKSYEAGSFEVLKPVTIQSKINVQYPVARILEANPECQRDSLPISGRYLERRYEVRMQVGFDGKKGFGMISRDIQSVQDVLDFEVEIPESVDVINISFSCFVGFGMQGWRHDNVYGANYSIPVEHTPASARMNDAVLFFEDTPGMPGKVFGDLVGGKQVKIDYTNERIRKTDAFKQCQSVSMATGTTVRLSAGFKFNDDNSTYREISNVAVYNSYSSFDKEIDGMLTVPQGAYKMEMWFFCEDKHGNRSYDSNLGSNYIFNF